MLVQFMHFLVIILTRYVSIGEYLLSFWFLFACCAHGYYKSSPLTSIHSVIYEFLGEGHKP